MTPDSKTRPGRVIATYLAITVGAVILGTALPLLNVFFISPWWIDLGWRRPVAEWLLSIGVSSRYWGLIWLHIPDWTIALLLGVCGAFFLRRKWLIAGAVPCALAYVFSCDLLIFLSGERFPYVFSGPNSALILTLLDLPAALLIFVPALIFSGSNGTTENTSAED